jgi:hypothetical protein
MHELGAKSGYDTFIKIEIAASYVIMSKQKTKETRGKE